MPMTFGDGLKVGCGIVVSLAAAAIGFYVLRGVVDSALSADERAARHQVAEREARTAQAREVERSRIAELRPICERAARVSAKGASSFTLAGEGHLFDTDEPGIVVYGVPALATFGGESRRRQIFCRVRRVDGSAEVLRLEVMPAW